MSNYVMTGHAGLIGSALTARLDARGAKPLLLVDRRSGVSLSDIERITLTAKPDVFYHLAAFCKVSECVAEPEACFIDNTRGAEQAIEFALRNGAGLFVYFSSARVLAEPRNVYVASKLYGEQLCMAYAECYGLKTTVIRPSTVYGPWPDATDRVLNTWIRNALTGKPLVVKGDVNKTLEFTYIDDFLDALDLIVARAWDRTWAWNVAGDPVRMADAAEMVIAAAGVKGQIEYQQAESWQPQQPRTDVSATRELLGWSPKVGIEQGIKKTVRWYKEHIVAETA